MFLELPCVVNDGVSISFRSDKRVPVEPGPGVTIETPGRYSNDVTSMLLQIFPDCSVLLYIALFGSNQR